MLCRLLKHDFTYSAKTFLAMGAIAIAIAFIMAITSDAINQMEGDFIYVLMMVLMLGIVGMAIAAIVQIFQFYHRSFFSHSGYLQFTLPVRRGTQLASKLIVSMAWFLYALTVAVVAIAIIIVIADGVEFRDVFPTMFNTQTLVTLLDLFFLAIAAIALMFFCITLAHSVFFNKRIHGIISGIIGFLYTGLAMWVVNLLQGRYLARETIERIDINGGITAWDRYWPQVGLEYGRLVVYENEFGWHIFIDIYTNAAMLGFAALAIAATWYLLKKRVSLR
ncbi:MAG: hypothetical protein FWC93_05700 [Defluviitaleaceae bacterium]|nr:hypothetical protein [Defluviitaleaceae bacterium]